MPQTQELNGIADALEKVAELIEKSASRKSENQSWLLPEYGSLGEASRDDLDPLTRFLIN